MLVLRVPAGAIWDECEGCQIEAVKTSGNEVKSVILTQQFVAARDPSVSFDGTTILFAGRKTPTSRWQIWRMDRDGSNPVQVTHGPGHSHSPLWVGSLFHLDDTAPTDRIIYVSTDHGWLDENSHQPTTALFAANLDGSNPLRITYNMLSDFGPEVLPSGRVVFTSTTVGADGISRHGLLAVNIDGTDLMPFAGVHQEPSWKRLARVGGHGWLYLIDSAGKAPLEGGHLAAVNLRRPLHGYHHLTDTSDGLFSSPLPLTNGELLVSHREPDQSTPFAIHHADPKTGRLGRPVLADKTNHLLPVAELAERPRVNGRSSVVDLRKESGIMFCLSSHISDRPEINDLQSGAMHTLRVVEGVPSTAESSNQNPSALSSHRILGEVPIESDGSFHIEVPARTPLRLEIMNAEGEVVARQDSWTWVMPREWRGCIGCHEDRETSPPNRLAEAVVKPAVSLVPAHSSGSPQ
ncbi:MAG: hypothetical protein GY906_04500 [bacterium]|nr:hypothetical protein [bacterium]